MDDFNTSVLSEAKNEYSSRLVSILTIPIMQGFKSIFKEAKELCTKNEEDSKYLMTFQNFLTRVPRWNQEIINVETNRIVETSKCPYLSDLLTCVHITQLKILTSIRVSNKQKKIDIDIPKLHNYIHKVYITAARKIYQNVYLFEENILPLDKQKNMRECETIIKESIFNVIRESMPIEKILRAYIDETTEEELVEEIEKVPVPVELVEPNIETVASKDKDAIKTDVITKDDTNPFSPQTRSTFLIPPATLDIPSQPSISTQALDSLKTNTFVPLNPISQVESIPPISPSKISFNDKDHVVKYSDNENPNTIATTKSEVISAPKTIDRLERISNERNEQRKLEEADDDDGELGDSIKIHDGGSISLNTLDVEDLSSVLKLNNKPELNGIEVLA